MGPGISDGSFGTGSSERESDIDRTGAQITREEYDLQPMDLDTSPEAAAVQIAVQRRLSGEERLALAIDMSDMARELALAGIRQLHPDWSEERVRTEYLRRLFPADRLPAPLR